MAALDTLPADQRAVLQLVLKQGRSYDQIAGLLRISPEAVAERAHKGLEALGPATARLAPDRRGRVSDYLLGQLPASQRQAVRDELEASASARAWARVVSTELRALAGDALPEVPADPREQEEAFDALEARRDAEERHERSSRLGGVLLLVGLLIALLALVLWQVGAFEGDDEGDLAQTPPTQTQAPDVQPIAQVNLRATGGGRALAVAIAVTSGEQQAIRVDAEGLPGAVRRPSPEAGACIFLYSSARQSRFIGCFQEVDRQGRASASGGLPADIRDFREVVITQETGRDTPTRPGRIILRGPVQAAPAQGAGGRQGTQTTP